MFSRMTTLLAILLLSLTLAACGSPVAAAPATPVLPTATVAPTATTTFRPVPMPSAPATSVSMPMPSPIGTACYPLQSSYPAPDQAAPATPGATIAVTALAVAPTVDTQNLPLGTKTEFARGESVCIAYTLTNANAGDSLAFRFFRDDKIIPINGTPQTFERGFASVNDVREWSQPEPGTYRIELFLNGAATPSRTITFTVR